MIKLYIAQNDETGDFYLTDDSDLALHGEVELTSDGYANYSYITRKYDDWQMFIAAAIRKNREVKHV